jgi:hypothetical protein
LTPAIAMGAVTLISGSALIWHQHGLAGALRWIGVKLILIGEILIDLGAAYAEGKRHAGEEFRAYQRRRAGEEI